MDLSWQKLKSNLFIIILYNTNTHNIILTIEQPKHKSHCADQIPLTDTEYVTLQRIKAHCRFTVTLSMQKKMKGLQKWKIKKNMLYSWT